MQTMAEVEAVSELDSQLPKCEMEVAPKDWLRDIYRMADLLIRKGTKSNDWSSSTRLGLPSI